MVMNGGNLHTSQIFRIVREVLVVLYYSVGQIREWRAAERGQWDRMIAVVVWLQRKLRIADVSTVPEAAWERSLGRKQRSAARMVIFAASAVHREPAAAAAAPAVATAADLLAASPGVDNAAPAIAVAPSAFQANGAAQASAATPPTRRRSRRLKEKKRR